MVLAATLLAVPPGWGIETLSERFAPLEVTFAFIDHGRDGATGELSLSTALRGASMETYRDGVSLRNLFLKEGRPLVRREPPPDIVATYLAAANAADQATRKQAVEQAWQEQTQGLDLRRRDLREAFMSDVRLFAVNLQRAQLQGADLEEARLYGGLPPHFFSPELGSR